jgi:hypothetical protein
MKLSGLLVELVRSGDAISRARVPLEARKAVAVVTTTLSGPGGVGRRRLDGADVAAPARALAGVVVRAAALGNGIDAVGHDLSFD